MAGVASAAAGNAQDALRRHFQVVSGKGGVGRSTVAAAIAQASAEGGARTLLLDLDGGAAAQLLGRAASVDRPAQVGEGLWACTMTPQGAMSEYALMVLKFRALYSLVFENRMVQLLLGSIPSLAEFTMMGKTWFHATERLSDGGLRFDRVILDAPATGHALTFLSVARVVAEVVPPGVMKEAARRMAELVEDPEDSCLHIVALPEELPVTEGLELADAARERLKMSLGLGVVNRALPPLCQGSLSELSEALKRDAELYPYGRVLEVRAAREAEQRAQAARFADGLGVPCLYIPDEAAPAPERTLRVSERIGPIDAAAEARAS